MLVKKLKPIKITAITLVLVCIIYIANIFIKSFTKTDIFYKLGNKSIPLEQLINDNPSFYSKNNKNNIDTNCEIYTEEVNELFIPSYNYFDLKYDRITDMNYLSKMRDVTSLVYELEYVPKNLNKILNNMSNLKAFSFIPTTDILKDNSNFNINYIKGLDVESFKGHFYRIEHNSVVNSYNNLKTATLYTDLKPIVKSSTDVIDIRNILLSNKNIENLYYNCSFFDSYTNYYIGTNVNVNDYFGDRTLNVCLDMINLKNLSLNSNLPITVEFVNDSEDIQLDSLKISKSYIPRLKSKSKIKVNNLYLLNNFFINSNIEENISAIDFDSIKKLSIAGREYFIIFNGYFNYDYNSKLRFLNKLTNLEELELKLESINELDFIESMNSLKKLSINLVGKKATNFPNVKDNIEPFGKDFYSSSSTHRRVKYDVRPYKIKNLDKLINLEHLTLKIESGFDYSVKIENINELVKLKNLKTLVINSELEDQLPKLENVKIIIIKE